MSGASRARAVSLLCALALAWVAGCTEDTLTGIDPETSPGQGSATIEVVLSASELPGWRDTTFTGYALASTSSILLVAREADIGARVLARFSNLPDSVFVDDDRLPIENFQNGRLRLVIDTLASSVPEAGAVISAHALTRGFVAREANWTQAGSDEPWAMPGGDLGEQLGTLSIASTSADTVFLPLSVDTDSLLRAWRAADGEFGLALLTDTQEASLTLRQVVLAFDAKPVGRDTLVETLRATAPATFIFDPETPAPGSALRLGGLPAARTYVSFRLPETVGGVDLRGARINRATLLLMPVGGPSAPFSTTDTLLAGVFGLLSNPFEFGPKAPVGGNVGTPVEIVPEDMSTGIALELPITGLVQEWAAAEAGSTTDLNLGIRALPEGGAISFWEFGDVQDPLTAPRVRILLTPPTPFDLP